MQCSDDIEEMTLNNEGMKFIKDKKGVLIDNFLIMMSIYPFMNLIVGFFKSKFDIFSIKVWLLTTVYTFLPTTLLLLRFYYDFKKQVCEFEQIVIKTHCKKDIFVLVTLEWHFYTAGRFFTVTERSNYQSPCWEKSEIKDEYLGVITEFHDIRNKQKFKLYHDFMILGETSTAKPTPC